MKKIILGLFSMLVVNASAQSSLQLTNLTYSFTVNPNQVINYTVAANLIRSVDFNIKNVSGSTNSYVLKRYDILLNPGVSTAASAYFCFAGGCYPSQTMVSPSAITLTPGQDAKSLDTPTSTNNELTTDLAEADKQGVSRVKYTFYNTANANDSLQFMLTYNDQVLGIRNIDNTVGSFDLIPNPASESAQVKFFSYSNNNAKLTVYNSLGAVLYNKDLNITEGSNSLQLNVEKYPAGIYFVNIKTADLSFTKKLVVE